MVLETLRRVGVLTETLTLAVVVMVIHATEPLAGTLDAEMVLGIDCQLTLSCAGLQQRLRHGDRSRDTIIRLLLNSGFFPLIDIGEIHGIQDLGMQGHREP